MVNNSRQGSAPADCLWPLENPAWRRSSRSGVRKKVATSHGGSLLNIPGGGGVSGPGPQHHGSADGGLSGARVRRGASDGGRPSRTNPTRRPGHRAQDRVRDLARTRGATARRPAALARRSDPLGAEHHSPWASRVRPVPPGRGPSGGSDCADAARATRRPRVRRAECIADRPRTVQHLRERMTAALR